MESEQPLDIVMFGFNDWRQWAAQGFCTRSGAYARELSRHSRVGRMLVVSASSSYAMRAVRRLTASGTKPPVRRGVEGVRGLVQMDERVWVLDHTRLFPREGWYEPFYRANGLLHDARLRDRVSQATSALGMKDHVLWIADPLMAKHMGRMGENVTVFDADDDWSAHPELVHIRRAVERGYAIANQRADVIFTVSTALMDRFAESRALVRWQPNAVDFRLFDPPAEKPPELAGFSRPVFGYVGVMQERMDVGAVSALARANPHGSVVLVGPVSAPAHFAALRDLPNVHFLGERHHSLVPSYLAGFDVCIMPHVHDELTRSMNPLKIYEYLASGRPVVTLGLAGFEDTEGIVARARDAEEFVRLASVAASVPGDPEGIDARRRYAAAHSWECRVDEMLALVRAARSRPRPGHSGAVPAVQSE